jgi:hypothetical protein
MTLAINDIVSAVTSHAMASGLFEQVNGHEPKNPPGNGLSAAVWVERIRPARTSSGLSSTSGYLQLSIRLYSNLLSQPEDWIDPALTAAVDALMSAYSGDFTLGGLVRSVDLLGAEGESLEAASGYLAVSEGEFRVFTITLPLIINDLWEQAP